MWGCDIVTSGPARQFLECWVPIALWICHKGEQCLLKPEATGMNQIHALIVYFAALNNRVGYEGQERKYLCLAR